MSWDGNAVLWRGRPSYQLPADLIHLQHIVWSRRPDWIIETGGGGGTTQFLRDVCRVIGRGWVVPVSEDSLANVPDPQGLSVMAILDSDVYSVEHMRAELAAYAPLVTKGQVLVVCHTDRPDWGSAPALTHYLSERPGWMWEPLEGPSESLNTYLIRQ